MIHPDLDSRAAVHDLVVRFYREVVFDELLEPVFDDVAEVDWSEHLPKLVDYWCRVLLGDTGYDGFILGAHQRVHDLEPLTPELFDRWFSLWVATVDAGWSGPGAERAKEHAARIGAVLARRVVGIDWFPPRGPSVQLPSKR
ncbi:MAG: group III truncated hemoglobin [Acidimicrobiales bacterium]